MIKPWKKLGQTAAYRGYRKIDKTEFELPGGHVFMYDIYQEIPVVAVLALTPDHKVILAKQFRPGPEHILLELPGGVADPGETQEQGAARELLEETGYAGDLKFIGTSLHDAYSTRIRHNFVATDCKKMAEVKDDPREPIEAVPLPLEQFRTHLRSGELTDVATGYLGLDYLGLL